MKASERLIQAVGIAAEVTGTMLSDGAFRLMVHELAAYPEPQAIGALKRCCRELKGRLTLAEVLSRVDDGRPGPEEAWSLIPKDEDGSCAWTEEMRQAYGAAAPLIADGDLIAARKAFLEAYVKVLLEARAARIPAQWSLSLGHDKSRRELAILDAVEKGRLSAQAAQELLPYHREEEGINARLLALASGAVRRLEVKA